MIKATIQNLSTFERDHWVTVTFPSEKVQDFGVECSFVTSMGDVWRAVRGKTTGDKTVYRIFAVIDAQDRVSGTLENSPSAPMDAIPPFKIHPWVIDDPKALFPYLHGMESEILSPPQLIEQSPAHMRWHLKFKVPEKGLIVEWWADMLHNDPVMPCKGKIVWSDRNDPANNRTFEAGELQLGIGEYFVLDFAARKGMQPPIQLDSPRSGAKIWVSILNDKPITLNDGAGIPISLNLLGYANRPIDTYNNNEVEDKTWVRDSIFNLQAAMTGDIFGACNEWNQYWCAAGNIPPSYPGHIEDARADSEVFKQLMSLNFGHFEPIDIGIGKTPGQTGKQEDFGATKGTHVVLSNQIDFIPAYQFVSYCELFRGINHYESDGTKLRAVDHPQWVTWSGRTHWHSGVSPDRLGKQGDAPPGTGWWGYDDQHRSQNNFAAYAMLSDDPLVDDQMEHQYETDRASYRIKFPTYGAGAARAQGRQVGCWSQFVSLTHDEKWRDLIDRRALQSMTVDSMNVMGPMKALAVIAPDGRKRIYRDGKLAPTVSLWEHGLAAVGLYKAYQNNPSDTLARVLDKVCNTLMEFGWFVEKGKRYVVGDIMWNEGQSVDLRLSNGWDENGTNPMTQQFVYTQDGRGINSWTMAGLRVAREFLEVHDTQLNALLDTPVGDQEDAEWRAIENK